jgi:hypothetical protein
LPVKIIFNAFHERWKVELDILTSLPRFGGPFLSTLPNLDGLIAFAMDVVLLT